MSTSPWRLVVAVVLGVSIGAIASAFLLGAVRVQADGATDIKYAIDSATFGLTIIQVLLAILAIGLGALAIVGYSDIRRAAEANAKRTAERVAKEVVEEQMRIINERSSGARFTAPNAPPPGGSEAKEF